LVLLAACGDVPSTPADMAADLRPALGPSGRQDLSITIDGVDRNYILYVPDTAIAAMALGPVPILFGFHGAGGDPESFMVGYGFAELASGHAFVLALPAGWNQGWFVASDEGWPQDDGQSSSTRNDVHLVAAILDQARTSYLIDDKRAFACGVSRGGAFTGI